MGGFAAATASGGGFGGVMGGAGGALSKATGVSRYGCFTADTPVLMADGTAKPIGEVAVGERVVSHDPITGEDVEAEVEATHVHHDVPTLEITTTAGTITTTSTHPFYVQGRGWTPAADLRRGDRLKTPDTAAGPDPDNRTAGDGTTTGPSRTDDTAHTIGAASTTGADAGPTGDGQAVAVITIRPTGRTTTVHNLTVRSTHNYHVLTTPTTSHADTTGPDTDRTTTPTPVLVHNNGDACGLDGGAVERPKGDGLLPDKEFPSRHAAYRDAKRDAGVPMSEQPSRVRSVKMSDSGDHAILDDDGCVIMTTESHFTGPGHKPVVIQNHAAGHVFPDGGVEGPHYNVRPPNQLRTGKVRGTSGHYGFPV